MSFESMARQIAEDATRSMTRDARSFASSQGWPASAVRTLKVVLEGDKWSVHSDSEGAADLEYGTDEARPSAVLRQLSNRPEILERSVLSLADRALKGWL